MNQRTIKKVLDELAKDKPDLSYIKGLLEGLVDDVPSNAIRMPEGNKVIDEVPEPKSRIEQIKQLAENSISNG